MAAAKPGISRPMVISVKTTVLPGKFVRSTSHAAGIPKKKATASEQNAKPRVFQSTS